MNPGRIFQSARIAHSSGDVKHAILLYHRVLKIHPDHVPTLNNLGAIHLGAGQEKEAMEYFNRVLHLKPDHVDAINNLGVLFDRADDHRTAAYYFRKALNLQPMDAELQTNLGSALKSLGDLDAAERCLQKALTIDPQNPKAHNNLALVYKETGKIGSAISSLNRALILNPDDEKVYFNLAETLVADGRFEEAVAVSKKAIAKFPDSITTLVGTSRVFIECGLWEKADPRIESAVGHPFAIRDLDLLRHVLLFLNASAAKKQDVARLHFLAGRLIQEKTRIDRHKPPFDFRGRFQGSDKPRIGYVSPDFNRHSVGYFFREIVRHHNRDRFEIYCYSLTEREDPVTRDIEAYADVFRRVHPLTTIDIARQIYQDRIEILVDLAGYTRNNRLDVFALRPAPVQVTAIGYPHGTGLPTMDYRISDAFAEGGHAESEYQEDLLFMPGCFLPFPAYEPDTPVVSREQLGIPEGKVVFASFNAWHKLRPEVLRLWNQILRCAQESVLVFSFRYAETRYARERILSYFDVEPRRILLLPQTVTESAHRGRYRNVDIALDPFPYNGTTTSWEALYMGVPVVTLRGTRHVQRTTWSILANLKLEELAVEKEAAYVETAVRLATRPDLLNRMRDRVRESVRQRLQSGSRNYVAALEDRFEEIRRRCRISPNLSPS